jgi:hypothetical protein
MNTKLVLMVLSAMLFVGCSDDPESSDPDANLPPIEAGIYTTGYEYTKVSSGVVQVWKGEKTTTLTSTTNTGHAESYDIFLTDKATYVAGTESETTHYLARYWKNGNAVTLTDGKENAVAKGIFVSGNDVHVVGYDGKFAMYWKNGVATKLSSGAIYASAEAVTVSNGDVYIAGTKENNANKLVATYWKNGTPVDLGEGKANDIFIDGNNVYVAGYMSNDENYYNASYWKNGTITTLSTEESHLNSIVVSQGNVYVAGTDYNSTTDTYVLKYWKNDNDISPEITEMSDGQDILVDGDDVYVVGEIQNTEKKRQGVLYKNGVATYLTDGTYYAYANAIAQKK